MVILSTIIIICGMFHIFYTKSKEEMQNGMQIISSYYHIPVPIVGLAIYFTLIYNYIDLSKHGLTYSTIGSVVLSLVPPMAVFFIGVAIKRHNIS